MPGRGKPIPTTTKLGRRIRELDMKVYDVCGKAQIHNRLMTEYIAGRRVINAAHADRLSRVLDCKPEDIVDEEVITVTGTTGTPLNGKASVKDIDMSHLQPQLERIKADPAFNGAHTPSVAPERLIRKAV